MTELGDLLGGVELGVGVGGGKKTESAVANGIKMRTGGYLGQVLLGMCHWPLRTTTPL